MAIDAALVGTRASGAGASLTTGSGTTTTGSTFAIAISFDNTVTISTVADSKGNTYTIAGSVQQDGSISHKKALYYCQNGTGGSGHTATVTFSGGSFGTVYLIEVTGAATASFDKTAQGADNASPYTVTLPTLSQADEVIITIHGSRQGGSVTYASSNTTILSQESDGDNYWTSVVSKVVVASTTAFSPSFTGGDTDTAQVAATFKASAGGGSSATATPTTGSVVAQGRAPLVNNFTAISLRGTLVNEAGSPLGNLTGVSCLVWYGSAPAGAPSESLSSLTTNANGSYSFALALGGLAFNDPVYRVIYQGSPPTRNHAGRRIPSYDP
jgi:hypothetical protein